MSEQVKRRRVDTSGISKLPIAEAYEKSYSHSETVTHILCTPKSGFIVTADAGGDLKFWKKTTVGIEFVKRFKAHIGPIVGLSCTPDGSMLCSVGGDDKSIKIFDVIGFDMINYITTAFKPASCSWISRDVIACGDQDNGKIHLFKSKGSTLLGSIGTLHSAPVHLIKHNSAYSSVISCDISGQLEVWSSVDIEHYDFQEFQDIPLPTSVTFHYKMETDLYEFVKTKPSALVTSLVVSSDGEMFVTTSTDQQVRVFDFSSCKKVHHFDESKSFYEPLQNLDTSVFKVSPVNFARIIVHEQNLVKTFLNDPFSLHTPRPNCVFDSCVRNICVPTMMGIKIINLSSGQMIRLLGMSEHDLRFLNINLFEGSVSDVDRSVTSSLTLGDSSTEASSQMKVEDPTFFCSALKKKRFFMFTRREPVNSSTVPRDIFNERPVKGAKQVPQDEPKAQQVYTKAVLHTSKGDVFLDLYPDRCPKTVENFTRLAAKGYYDNLIFHRVIRNFMLQTGDPLGNGTGGESIWGKEFEDEFSTSLRHDSPGILSMANAGPGTNGSQFL